MSRKMFYPFMKYGTIFLCSSLVILILPFSLPAQTRAGDTVSIRIDGSHTFQQIDGIGVNANTRSFVGDELKPALNMLIDSMHANIWRVVVETVEKWEDENDNADPFTFNWTYYDRLYETPKFRKAWNMINYLNEKGITDNLMINFMGAVPKWMGGESVLPKYEDEYIEMLSSFFYYAIKKRHLKIGYISLMNEPDIRKEGPTVNPVQYVKLLHKLIERLDKLGIDQVKYVGPDVAGMGNGMNDYLPKMMQDTLVMNHLAHVGLHSYGGYYANVDSALRHSPYPRSDYWITEWNAWRDGLDDGLVGVYDYTFASQCVGYLLDLLNHNATACLEWEAYDSYYEHHFPSRFSYWGILGYDPKTKTYSPRKHFYAIKQISDNVKPGSYRISVTGNRDDFIALSFYDSATRRVSVVGMNKNKFPVALNGTMEHLLGIRSFRMTHTDSTQNGAEDKEVMVNDGRFETTIGPNTIFALAGNNSLPAASIHARPEPAGWYTGDIHVHLNCGEGSVQLPEDSLTARMEANDLDIISLLADMGNGEVKVSTRDLPKVNGQNAPQSTPNRIIHWDAEWHWDATYSNFGHMALGGHLVLLGLKEAHQIWDESPYTILQWARKQNAVRGFAHFEYLNTTVQDTLNCCIPVEYPVEAALHTIDFVSEDVYGTGSPNNGNYSSEGAIDAYYKLLNCGFRLGLAAGTDYPCNDNEPFGKLLTYVKVKGPLTYDKWINGIREGRTVVSRNGHEEFLEMKINDRYEPGDELRLEKKANFSAEIKWTAVTDREGTIELVQNGKVIATRKGRSGPGHPLVFKTEGKIGQSGWIVSRRMDDKGEHILQSAPVFMTVQGKPVRASSRDAEYFVSWIDNMLKNVADGGKWAGFFSTNIQTVRDRYRSARNIYQQIAKQAAALGN